MPGFDPLLDPWPAPTAPQGLTEQESRRIAYDMRMRQAEEARKARLEAARVRTRSGVPFGRNMPVNPYGQRTNEDDIRDILGTLPLGQPGFN